MFTSAIRAIDQLFTRPFRGVLFKSLGLTIGSTALVWLGLISLAAGQALTPYPWLDTIILFLGGAGMLLGIAFLIGPITALFAGIFLDDVAEEVEKKYYKDDKPGVEQPIMSSMGIALKFTGIVVLVNILLLPTFFIQPFNLLAYLIGNGYLLGREYFEMVGLRHMSLAEVKALRRKNRSTSFFAGLLIAGLATIPFVNLLVPLFATAFMVHVFKSVAPDMTVSKDEPQSEPDPEPKLITQKS